MDFWKLVALQPWAIVALAFMMCWLILGVWRLFLRHLNIRSKGWPPPHLDADGDSHHPGGSDENDDIRTIQVG